MRIAVFALLIAPACAPRPTHVESPVAEIEPASPEAAVPLEVEPEPNDAQRVLPIAGTVWAGEDSDGDTYVFEFREGGTLYYESPTGFFKNGTWRQDGAEIYFEMNEKYSEYRGILKDGVIAGNGWNKVGRKWTWSVKQIAAAEQ